MRVLTCSLVLACAAVLVTTPLPRPEAAAAPPVPADTGPNSSLEPERMPGTALPPADPAKVRREIAGQSRAAAAARPQVSGYYRSPDSLFELPVGHRPYDTTQITPAGGFGLVDAEGVRMFKVAGKLYNHPVFQGAYALQNLNSYRLTGNQAYLDIALKNAQRIADRHVDSDGAWYFPYEFDYAPLGDTSEMLHAPWYSGMAQGRELSVFVRMFQVTGDAFWRTAADATFASMGQAPSGTLPYGSYVDSRGHLWFEEYPRYPAARGENVLNGHIFATWGLLDYWSLTRSAAAARLIRGAIATVKATAATATNGFRRPNGSSLYSLRHKTPANSYHQIHVEQFLQWWQFTHDAFFVNTASAYRGDYPKPATAGTMRVTPRTSTIYQISSTFRITRTSRVHFSRISHAPTDRRQRVFGGPVVLRVTKGTYRGWWFPEAYGVTWLLGATDTHGYSPAVRVRLAPGTYSAYRLGSSGAISGHKTVTFRKASSAPSAVSGIVQGRPAFYLTAGTYAGLWLPVTPGISVAP